jgi:hypothetical protein
MQEAWKAAAIRAWVFRTPGAGVCRGTQGALAAAWHIRVGVAVLLHDVADIDIDFPWYPRLLLTALPLSRRLMIKTMHRQLRGADSL